MPVTLRELAKATGFSVATVSRVLNGRSHPVSDETKQQILATAKELGYRPNLVGRSLRSARTYTIGLIVDNIASPFPPIVIRRIQGYLQQFNYFRIVINADSVTAFTNLRAWSDRQPRSFLKRQICSDLINTLPPSGRRSSRSYC